jgi:alpha-tubulin suppressor-like RCC1 family protein
VVFGENKYGQHGAGDASSRPAGSEVVALRDAGVTKVAAGWSHSAALTREGRVLLWGRGNFGQLGHGTRADSASPRAVSLPADAGVAVDVACGSEHTLVLTERGVLFAWGWNEHGRLLPAPRRYCLVTTLPGQLGIGGSVDALVPTRVPLPAPVSSVSCGAGHSFAVLVHNSSLIS